MSMKEVVVIDYGLNNLLSVQRALEYCGARVITTQDHAVILNASSVVLPGVGAFGSAMNALNQLGLVDVVRDVAKSGTPLLGICLGMQLLLTESDEFGVTQGLNLIPGRAVTIPTLSASGKLQKIPHIGWSELISSGVNNRWSGTIFDKMKSGLTVYFVHSFMAKLEEEKHEIASCCYGEQIITAALMHENIMGCQFHPEKSGEVGLNILKNFLVL